jgi:hypothetical protein
LQCQLGRDIVFHCDERFIKGTMKLWRDKACCQTYYSRETHNDETIEEIICFYTANQVQ